MQAKRDNFVKIPLCVAAVLSIVAGLAADPVEKENWATSFRRADFKTGPVAPPLERPVYKPSTVVSPDDKYAATSAKDGKIRYYHAINRKVEKTFYACEPAVLAFSADGKFLMAVGTCHTWGRRDECTVKIWSLRTVAWPAEIHVPGRRPDAIAGSGKRVIVSSDAGIHCYLYPEGTMEWSASKPADVCDLQFSGDGQSVLVSFIDGSCDTYDAQSGVKLK
jgi:WD40 repeat protein